VKREKRKEEKKKRRKEEKKKRDGALYSANKINKIEIETKCSRKNSFGR
jgi:hypothetical protein